MPIYKFLSLTYPNFSLFHVYLVRLGREHYMVLSNTSESYKLERNNINKVKTELNFELCIICQELSSKKMLLETKSRILSKTKIIC